MNARSDTPDDDFDAIGTLIKRAGERTAIPERVHRRALRQVEKAFEQAVQARRRKHWLGIAAAASVVLAVGVLVLNATRAPVPAQMAAPHFGSVIRMEGAPSRNGQPLAAGNVALRLGDLLETGSDGRLSVNLSGGGSLRVDRSSSLQLVSARRIELMQGAVYVDSRSGRKANADAPPGLVVATTFGDAWEVGTQYEVRVERQRLSVSVREGSVSLLRDGARHRAEAGTGLRARASGGVSRVTVETAGAQWQWAEQMAPGFTTKDASVLDFLTWVARETGRELHVEDDAVRQEIQSARLPRGPLEGLTPQEALDVVIRTTRFTERVRVEPDRVVVSQ